MGASNQKHTKNLEKAQGKSMDPESSDKIGSLNMISDEKDDDEKDDSDARLNSDLINQFGGHYEKKIEELAEKYFKKVADSMSREISSLKQKIVGIDGVIARLESEKTNLLNETKQKISDLEKQVEDKVEEIAILESDKTKLLKENKQVEDKDEKIARLEREKNDLLHEKTQNEGIIRKNQEKIDTLTQEKEKLERELQKKEKELKEDKIKAEIELEKVRKEKEKELQEDKIKAEIELEKVRKEKEKELQEDKIKAEIELEKVRKKKEKELQEDKIKAEIELEKVRKELNTEKGLHLQSKCQANIDKAALKKEIAGYKK